VKTGVPASIEETATLPPTQTIAAAPAATPIAVPRVGASTLADGTAGIAAAGGMADGAAGAVGIAAS
jgi:hypothetical protein